MRQSTVNEVLRSVSPGDLEFFPTMVRALSETVSADIVFVAKIDEAKEQAEALFVHGREDDLEPFKYDLEHTPCSDIVYDENSTRVFNDDVQEHFPKDDLLVEMGVRSYLGTPLRNSEHEVVGLLVALYKGPIEDPFQAELIFNLFSGMASRELALIEKTRRLSTADSVFRSLDEAIVIFDSEMSIQLVNKAYERITGYNSAELMGKNVFSSHFLGRSEQLRYTITESMESVGSWVGEINGRRKNGVLYTVQAQISLSKDKRGKLENYICVLNDITSKKHAEKTIHLQANYDSLTGLPNRQLFNDRLDQTIRIAKRKKKKFAVLFMDIDMFKSINDSLGHSWGDVLLAEVSYRLKRALRSSDTIARFGGDEFTFVIDPSEKVSDAVLVLESISKAMREPFNLQSNKLFVTSSLGVAFYPDDGESREQLISHADQAMYSAKNNGRNQYQFFTRDMHKAVEKKLALKNALQEAILGREIQVYYQRIVNDKAPNSVKLEALARWQKGGEWVSPEVFVAIAEEFNMIRELDDAVLEQVCLDSFKLQDAGLKDLSLCINRSPKELVSRAAPVKRWTEIIENHGLRVGQFEIEVTENILAKDSDGHFDVLYELADAGFEISIDDFGTGYCSLGYLNKFPINTIKIDKSFIDDLEGNDSKSAIVDAIMAMAKALGKNVIAEGVEHETQYQSLRKLGCEQFQGYLFARPLSYDALLEQLRIQNLLAS